MSTAIQILSNKEFGNIPLAHIKADPDQPRKDFDQDYIDELSASIKKDGVIQPIVIRPNPDVEGHYFVVAGENRYRASKLAKTKIIPAVMRETEGLDKLIIQLKENCQRKDLNPMEWALALTEMNKTHGLKQKDIEAKLKESGVGNLGRSYISNTMRLLALPEWAQELIRNAEIGPAHGKHLLTALASEKVTEALRVDFEERDDGEYPTTRELQDSIFWSYTRNHKALHHIWETKFDYKTECIATKCPKLKRANKADIGEGVFCLDDACYAIKSQEHRQHEQEALEAEEKKPDVPKEIIVADDNSVDLDQQELKWDDFIRFDHRNFEPTECSACPHRHTAKRENESFEACFNRDCFGNKGDEHRAALILVLRHIRIEVNAALTLSYDDRMKLMAWSAAGAPVLHDDGDLLFSEIDLSDYCDDDPYTKLLHDKNLTSLSLFLNNELPDISQIALFMVNELDAGDLLQLAAHYKIDLDNYLIDEADLDQTPDTELIKLLDGIDWDEEEKLLLRGAKEKNEINQFVLQNANRIGVPPAITHAYKSLIEAN